MIDNQFIGPRVGGDQDENPDDYDRAEPYDPRERTYGAEFEANDVHPCAFGRCVDPAAHAEGAHDL